MQRAVAELRPDHRELAERGVDDPLLELRVTLQDEAKRGREDKQQREDREEAVVGDRRGVVAALVVGVLLQHLERKADGAMPLLEAVEGAVSVPGSAHFFRTPRSVRAGVGIRFALEPASPAFAAVALPRIPFGRLDRPGAA